MPAAEMYFKVDHADRRYEITYVTSAGDPGNIGLSEAKKIFLRMFGISISGVEIRDGRLPDGQETIIINVTRLQDEPSK